MTIGSKKRYQCLHDYLFARNLIGVNLRKDIAGVNEVVDNIVRATGVTEWDYLLGRQLDFVFDHTMRNLVEHDLDSQLKPGQSIDKRHLVIRKTFDTHATGLFEIIFETNLAVYRDLIDLGLMTKNEASERAEYFTNHALYLIQSQGPDLAIKRNGLAILSTNLAANKQDIVAGIMGFHDSGTIPDSIPGSDNEWRAFIVLHELSHISSNFGETQIHLREFEADQAAIKLLEGHVSNSFIDYLKYARIIGAVNGAINAPMGEQSGHLNHVFGKHVDCDMLELYGEEYIEQSYQALASLINKSRDHLEANMPIHNRLDAIPLENIAQSIKHLTTGRLQEIEEHLYLDHAELVWATAFLNALDETGFFKLWLSLLPQNTKHGQSFWVSSPASAEALPAPS